MKYILYFIKGKYLHIYGPPNMFPSIKAYEKLNSHENIFMSVWENNLAKVIKNKVS